MGAMTTVFRYEPYVWVSEDGVPIGSIMPCGSEGSVHEGVPFKEVATMKILAVHDAQGNISASVVLPTDAPAAAIRVEPGQTITEIDGHNLKFDALKEQSYGRLIELIQNYRIKPITSKAKLIRK
jgi:hypothetical protein